MVWMACSGWYEYRIPYVLCHFCHNNDGQVNMYWISFWRKHKLKITILILVFNSTHWPSLTYNPHVKDPGPGSTNNLKSVFHSTLTNIKQTQIENECHAEIVLLSYADSIAPNQTAHTRQCNAAIIHRKVEWSSQSRLQGCYTVRIWHNDRFFLHDTGDFHFESVYWVECDNILK